MALRRFTQPVDGTIPVPALLYDDEELLTNQGNVGIYQGSVKSIPHQAGTVHLTSHRLFYIPSSSKSHRDAFSISLAYITQTDFYAGLLSSSPKVTLHLASATPQSGSGSDQEENSDQELWECEVCGNKNAPGSTFASKSVCALCGVPRSAVPSSTTSIFPTTSTLPPIIPKIVGPTLSPDSIACPTCTLHNPSSRRFCELCNTALPVSAAPSRPGSTTPSDNDTIGSEANRIKLSFRKGGVKDFYAVLKRSLKGKAWEGNGIGRSSRSSLHVYDGEAPSQNLGRSGITGIMRNAESSAFNTETGMSDALQDIEALMIKAKDMVQLAEDLNERLTIATANSAQSYQTQSGVAAEPEEATFIRSSLAQLGLQMTNAPVTLDMMKDERKWMEELSRELAKVLQGSGNADKRTGIMKDRGIVALDEVWGGWNRARGVALIPPSTFMLVLDQLPSWTLPPLLSRQLPSGLRVLHTSSYTSAAFASRLLGVMLLSGPRTTADVAREEGLTLGMAAEMIAEVEAEGEVCRDDPDLAGGGTSGAQLKWWINAFNHYHWDGQVI